jgi:LysR family transcriptional regulator, nitrogen assimilation regulatory protein
MDIRQLRYFVGVLEAKSLSKASGLLHIAQPALGVQVRNLERELGVKLLHRHPRGVAPTEAGERLAEHAGDLLRQFDRVRQDLIGYASRPSGPVLLCVSRNLPRIVTAAIAERCRGAFPDVPLRIFVGWQKQLNGMSKESEADVVLTFRPHNDAHFVSEPLIQDEMLLVCSANEGQLPREISFRRVIQRMLILPGEPHYIRCLVETAARLAGRELKVYCGIDSVETARELVKRGLASTILPIACVREDVKAGKLRTAKIKDPKFQRTLYMLHSSRQSRASAIDLIRREIRAIISEFAQDETFGWKKIM